MRPESVKRVPPPSFEQPAEVPAPPEPTAPDNRLSASSLEASYSMGRLTIANLITKIPQRLNCLLRPRKSPLRQLTLSTRLKHLNRPLHLPSMRRTSIDNPTHLDKPLPPPQIPTPQFSALGLPDLDTPKGQELPLPPPHVSQDVTPQPTQPKSLPTQTPARDPETPIPRNTAAATQGIRIE